MMCTLSEWSQKFCQFCMQPGHLTTSPGTLAIWIDYPHLCYFTYWKDNYWQHWLNPLTVSFFLLTWIPNEYSWSAGGSNSRWWFRDHPLVTLPSLSLGCQGCSLGKEQGGSCVGGHHYHISLGLWWLYTRSSMGHVIVCRSPMLLTQMWGRGCVEQTGIFCHWLNRGLKKEIKFNYRK